MPRLGAHCLRSLQKTSGKRNRVPEITEPNSLQLLEIAQHMIHARLNLLLTVVAASSIGASSTLAQQSMTHQFRAHNSRMAELQPSLITPLVAPDPRLVQYVKFAFANQYTSMSTQTVSFGNGRGGGVIAGNRFEFDVIPPSYIEHNSKAMDGFGDSSTLAKYRIASGNAAHGNFEVTHCWRVVLRPGVTKTARSRIRSAQEWYLERPFGDSMESLRSARRCRRERFRN